MGSLFTRKEAIIRTDISHETKKRVVLCINAALERKATNLTVLRVNELTTVADYFIFMSGSSDRQVQATAQFIRETLKKSNIVPLGIEGEHTGKWILMDYGDIVVHIFYEPVREFYDIENLWSDAPRMEIDDTVQKLTALDDHM
ncbi:MAG: ribosome silencing factor [Syntrophales bacterium]|nr:ribosome silencing factor [Syntrophales bacterium]MDY0044030.1 ribosome silencing factor [Syntrophales bacterium]